MQARFQINHFRCAIPLPMSLMTQHPEVLTASSAGSAVYAFGSLLNHSCCPNVDVQWRSGNADVSFVAATDMAPGEQLTVRHQKPRSMS